MGLKLNSLPIIILIYFCSSINGVGEIEPLPFIRKEMLLMIPIILQIVDWLFFFDSLESLIKWVVHER